VIAEEQFELLLSLDALNHNVEPQLRAEPRHPAQQGHSALVIDKSPKERLVDLDLMKRKAVQVAEARVGGTKVVQGDFHSQALQQMQIVAGSYRVLKKRGLGYFELKSAGRKIRCRENVAYKSRNIGAAKLHRREVDCDGSTPRPLQALQAGLGQNLVADFDDKTHFFGDG